LRLDAFLLADYAANAEGKLYVSGGGISRLNLPMFPFFVPMLSVVTRFVVEDEADYRPHTVRVRLESPDGVELIPGDAASFDVDRPTGMAEGEERSLQLVLNYGGIPILEEGIYTLTVELDDEVRRRMTLPAVHVPPPAEPRKQNRAERRQQERTARRTA
jgi:hypothetical protein